MANDVTLERGIMGIFGASIARSLLRVGSKGPNNTGSNGYYSLYSKTPMTENSVVRMLVCLPLLAPFMVARPVVCMSP